MLQKLNRRKITILIILLVVGCYMYTIPAFNCTAYATAYDAAGQNDLYEQSGENIPNDQYEQYGDSTPSDQSGLSMPSVKNITVRSKTSFFVTINTVKGAGGYYIYNIKDDGGLELLKTIKDNHTSRFVIAGLTYNNTYRLTVQAFKKNKGTGEFIAGPYDETGVAKKLKVTTKYKNGFKYYYDADGNVIKDVEKLLPKKRKYMIKVNTERCVMTIYAKDGRKGYRIPVKSFLCSPGRGTKSGTFSVGEKYRYRSLFYNSYSQWTTVIHGNILFHTTPYKSYGNNNTLDVAEYNKLGTAASHGCVRLQCVAVKWIYDNCPRGTKVVLYKSKKAGPFGKPKLEKLPKWHKWDPTDPTAVKRCKKHGCDHIM